ncbi:hypothetical protein FRX31_014812, partial [Thalictrum thalictroides]
MAPFVAEWIPPHSACYALPAVPEHYPALINITLVSLQMCPTPYLVSGEVKLISTLILNFISTGIQIVGSISCGLYGTVKVWLEGVDSPNNKV